ATARAAEFADRGGEPAPVFLRSAPNPSPRGATPPRARAPQGHPSTARAHPRPWLPRATASKQRPMWRSLLFARRESQLVEAQFHGRGFLGGAGLSSRHAWEIAARLAKESPKRRPLQLPAELRDRARPGARDHELIGDVSG